MERLFRPWRIVRMVRRCLVAFVGVLTFESLALAADAQPFALLQASGAMVMSRPPTYADPYALLREITRAFQVPTGFQYGIWNKESGRLAGGWSARWYLARELTKPGGTCLQKYRFEHCDREWRAVVVICAQRRAGRPICDPHEVRTSYAGAMGPMQLMPSEIVRLVRGSDGRRLWQWVSENIVDWNRDRVIDPHDLGDAFAMAARQLRRYFEKKGSWKLAAERYFGSDVTRYYDGREDRRGVYHYWQEWCDRTRSCQSSQIAYR